MDIMNFTIYNDIDNTIFKMMKIYLVNNDIDKIYKEWNFWDGRVERFKNNKQSRFIFEVLFIGNVLTAVARVQSYDLIEWSLEGYSEGNTCALLSFVLQNVKWSVLEGTGKKIFEGPLLPEAEERQGREDERTKKDKKQILLEKVQKEIIEEYPAFREIFYKKYRDNIASMVFNLNGNTNDSELLERLIEDEMIEDFSNFKIKQIENLLKNS
jgi:hypothetical protein